MFHRRNRLAAVVQPEDAIVPAMDFIQSQLAAERHAQFEREVAKDELARLVPTPDRGHLRTLVRQAHALLRPRAKRVPQALPARDA